MRSALASLQFRNPGEERAHLRSQVEALQAERDELAGVVDLLRKEKVDFTESLRKAQDAAAEAGKRASDAAKLSAEVEFLKQARDSALSSFAESSTALQSLREEAERWKTEAGTAAKELLAARTALTESETRCAGLSSEVRGAADRSCKQGAALEAALEAQRAAESSLREKQREAEALQASLLEVQQRGNRYLDMEAEAARVQSSLSATIHSEQEARKSAEERATAAAARVQAVQREVAEAQQRLDAADKRATAAELSVQELKTENMELRVQHRSDAAAATAAAAEEVELVRKESQVRVQALRDELAALKLQRDELRAHAGDRSCLQQELAEKQSALAALREALAAAEQRAQNAGERERAIEAESTKRSQEAEALKKAAEASAADAVSLRQRLSALEEELNGAAIAKVEESSRAAAMKKALEEAEKEISRLQAEVAQRGLEVEAVRLVQHDREIEGLKLRERYEAQARELEELQTRLVVGMGVDDLLSGFGGEAGRAVCAPPARGPAVGSGRAAAKAASGARGGSTPRGQCKGQSTPRGGGAGSRGGSAAEKSKPSVRASEAERLPDISLLQSAMTAADNLAGGDSLAAFSNRSARGPSQPPTMPTGLGRQGSRRSTGREGRTVGSSAYRQPSKDRPSTPSTAAHSDGEGAGALPAGYAFS
eukprot:TRINITY_DN31524_c0_g1_i1.p1 TRINITY_DN31524_c0_g1~~TRINITY_DN31524_c0_g1_i1.p1  ORF type:complete len:661 (+),score=210.00 TRINITY_DN31524_c0_g1_i1:112-2094(+)